MGTENRLNASTRVCHSQRVDNEPENYGYDFSNTPGAEERRAERDRARAEARRRYREFLVSALDAEGVPENLEDLADRAIDLLTTWTDVESGEPCHCSCHPRLPESDFHEYGFGCICRASQQDRQRTKQGWLENISAYWDSAEGRAAKLAAEQEDATLQAWLQQQPDVEVTEHGGWAPEQWEGSVAGRSFYFRERFGDWQIELDLRPNGHFARAFHGTDADGKPIVEPWELTSGDVIAEGSIGADGYGETPVERAQFIVGVIRDHIGVWPDGKRHPTYHVRWSIEEAAYVATTPTDPSRSASAATPAEALAELVEQLGC